MARSRLHSPLNREFIFAKPEGRIRSRTQSRAFLIGKADYGLEYWWSDVRGPSITQCADLYVC